MDDVQGFENGGGRADRPGDEDDAQTLADIAAMASAQTAMFLDSVRQRETTLRYGEGPPPPSNRCGLYDVAGSATPVLGARMEYLEGGVVHDEERNDNNDDCEMIICDDDDE